MRRPPHHASGAASHDTSHPCSVERGFFAGKTLDGLGRDLRHGRLTSRRLIEHALDDAARLNPILNCFVAIDAGPALAAADNADIALSAGRDRGPLHGIPVAIKDIIDIAGVPTTSGSRLFMDRVATADAVCVSRLREAGAILFGKTVLHELAYGITGDRSLHGASRNPYDPQRMSGGSSGGSAVAVAAGIVPLALGTDTAGSVRVPAALCGIVGFKPTFGAIPEIGVHALAPSLDHIGILAQTVEDTQIAFAVLTERDQVRLPLSAAPRIGWIDPTLFGPIDGAMTSMVQARLAASGLETAFVPIELNGDLFDVFTSIQSTEAYRERRKDLEQADPPVDPEVLQRLRHGATIPGWRFVEAATVGRRLGKHIDTLLERFDVLAMPTVPVTAPFVGERSAVVAGRTVEMRAALLSLTCLWNLTGHPALTIPAGLVDGLPTGLQLIGATGRDADLFATARRIENGHDESRAARCFSR